MKRNLRIGVSKKTQKDGPFSYRSVGVREKVLKLLFGDKSKLTILVPGDSIDEIDICKRDERRKEDEQRSERSDRESRKVSSGVC